MSVTIRHRSSSPLGPSRHHHVPRRHAEFERNLNALLADLQSTVAPHGGGSVANATSGYGSLNGVRGHRVSPTQIYQNRELPSPTYHNEPKLHQSYTHQSHSLPRTPDKYPSLNNNLSELDTLLQDLSSGAQRPVAPQPPHGAQPPRPSSGGPQLHRPSVDSLLEELDGTNGDMIYSGPKQVTITVKETKTETTGVAVPNDGYGTHTRVTASSATKELDDLMASLSDFKLNASSHQHQLIHDSPYALPTKASTTTATRNNLDCMLGNLQLDMSRQGVTTTQKGCCGACEKPIVGQVITALGRTWHPEHFTCAQCSQELGTRNFFERDGSPYCEQDYHNLFSPRCAYCNGPILDKCVTALDKTWHTEHFFCAQCGKQFGEEGFHEREGKPYCRDDYFDMFAPKCGGCCRAIMENYISALNNQWHPDCFVCRDCKLPVQGKSFYAMEGKPVCPKCIGADEEEEEDE